MKIVIDIPNVLYSNLKAMQNGSFGCKLILDRVKNGKKIMQGEWIIDGHHYKCSRCGKTLAIMFSETDDGDLIGCPFCLSEMKGGAK